jgi:hypothetical protein
VNEFVTSQAERKGPGIEPWHVTVIPALTDDQRRQLEEATGNRRITHRTIATVLTSWGHPVSTYQVGHWRRNHG